ncbi:hypothetical protein ACIGO8_28940 [Streptomyces sp. NPDC053493]|uniref:hypothetical protein n=1 Tax=Streptomyces sp. NPDC053493 TaxID=3365705 RepID=UPI0037D916D0
MLRPPTDSPSRDARPPRRPGVVVLPVSAFAALVALSVALTVGGGTDGGDPRATPALPAAAGSDTPTPPGAGAGTNTGAGTDGTSAGTRGQQPSAQGESPSPLPTPTRDRGPAPRTGRDHTGGAPSTGTPGAGTAGPGTTSPRPRTTPTTRRTPAAPAGTPYDRLRVGDCFDIDRDAPGTVVRRACDTPHDAEVVARLRLTGSFADDRAVRDAAAALCRPRLRAKAAEQPLGTRWTTFVQYPYRTSFLLGDDTVTCSLAAPSATGRHLTAPLQ